MTLPSYSPNNPDPQQQSGTQFSAQSVPSAQNVPAQPVAPTAVAGQVVEYVEIPGRGPVKLATTTQRFVSRLIDAGIFVVLDVLFILMMTIPAASDPYGDGPGLVGTFFILLFTANLFLIPALFVLGYFYESVMISFWGATVGKMLAGVKVVSSRTGEAPGAGAGFVRFLIPAGCAIIPIIGMFGTAICLLSPSFDSTGRRQGWHDKVANTLVVTTK